MMVSKLKGSGNEEELKFASRLKSLPVVMTTYIWLSQNYERLKAKSPLLKQTCELAEMTVQASVHVVAEPIAAKFKNQINLLDGLACAQLDRFENAFPLINKDTQTILAQSKAMLLGTTLVAHKLLDRVEKKVTSTNKPEQSQQQQPSSTSSSRQVVAHSYPPLVVRARLIAIMLIQEVKARIDAHLRMTIALLKHWFPYLDSLTKYLDELRKNVAYKLHDRFSITKDNLDLYKEYLDVLSRQFMVQDGRSLEHVNSLEERTKIIIRRNIGNLLILLQIISSNMKKISSYIFDNTILAFPKKTFCQISELFHKVLK